MKILLIAIAVFFIMSWFIVFWKFHFSGITDVLLVVAGYIILIRIRFNKELSKNYH
jgi:FtsH-binding integral membrane protein